MNHPEKKPSEENQSIQAFATILMAFGEIYITPEEEWDNLVLNRILAEGKEHVEESIRVRLVENEKEERSNEITESLTEKDILKIFVICGNGMEIAIFDPFIVGTLVSEEPHVPSFYYGIVKFMRKLPYCLLTVANMYFLIWKSSGLYFVFDCYGRERNLTRDSKSGVATLLALSSLKAVNHLFLNLSELQQNEVYILRKLKMINLYPCCTFENQIERRTRQREFEILNDHHAVLKGHLHIGIACFKENRYKFSLAIAIIAIIYSKIDAPSTWDSYSIDKTLMMANEYNNTWTNCNHNVELVIYDVPAKIDIGIYTVTILTTPIEVCGTWRCMKNFRRNILTRAIKRVFQKSLNVVVQIADKSYALWKRGGFYYLFDPYKHECRNTKMPIHFACLHMCSTVNMLCCSFQNQIVDLTSPSQFYVHSINITDIIVRDKYTLQDENTPTCQYIFNELEKDVEIDSLNTSLGDIKCEKALECVAEKYGFEPDIVNLDSPGISQTQIPPAYDDARSDIGVQEDEEEEEEGEEEDEDEGDEEESETEEGETDEDGIGKRRKRGKKGKRGGGKGGGKGKLKMGKKGKEEKKIKGAKDKKGKGAKEKKEKEEKEKSKKDEYEKGRKGKEKDEKERKQKEKVKKQKEKKEKEEKEKEKKEKEKKEKEKKETERKEKEKMKKEKMEKEKEEKEKKKKEKKEKEKKEKEKKEREKKEKEKKEKDKKGKEGKEKGKGGKGKEDGEGVGYTSEDGDDTDESSTADERKDKQKDKRKEKSKDKDKRTRGEEVSESSVSDLEEQEVSEFEERELPVDSLPNSYPGYTCIAHNLTVVGSESGNYESLCNLLKTGFICADRILVMTPWGNYVVFRSVASYFLYDGCTCNINKFRHLDLTVGTAGLLCFTRLHDLLLHIMRGRGNKSDKKLKFEQKYLDQVIDDICEQYCNSK